MERLTESSCEQATALKGIQAAMGSMDTNTQRNAAMVEETTAVTQVLASDANELTAQIGQFQASRPNGKAKIVPMPSNKRSAPAKPGGSQQECLGSTKAVGWEDF